MSPLRTRSRSVCKTHRRHQTYEAAHREVCRLFEEKGIRVNVFPSNKKKPCRCGGWHVGHLRKEQKIWELCSEAVQKGRSR